MTVKCQRSKYEGSANGYVGCQKVAVGVLMVQSKASGFYYVVNVCAECKQEGVK